MPPAGLVWKEDSPDGGGRRLVGNLSLIPIGLQGKRGYLIANVAVHPDFRGRGIGRELTTTALELLAAEVRRLPGGRVRMTTRLPSTFMKRLGLSSAQSALRG